MALENFCDKIIGIEDFEEVRDKLAEFDIDVLQTRDEHGNSLLHLVVENDCNANVFKAVLSISDMSVRNDDFKLAQDLFQDKDLEKEYVDEVVKFIELKLRNADGMYIRDLIAHGWDHVPFLKCAIDNMLDIMSDNFFDYLSAIEELAENVKMVTYEVINSDCEQLNLPDNYDTKQLLGMRNHCGLTISHVAIIFDKFELVNNMLTKHSDDELNFCDHLGRNILHYLYAMPDGSLRNDLIGRISSIASFNIVDIFGNPPAYYEYFSEMLKLDACKHWINAELLDVKNTLDTVKIQETSTNNDLDSTYLKKTVGKLLINALALLVEKRPKDPIEFLGCYLKFCFSSIDDEKYDFESLSCSKMIQLCPELAYKTFTFNPEIFSPFCKVARDKNGTPIGYKILIKKLKSIDSLEIDWFEIMKRGMNFGLRDSKGNTFIDLALAKDFHNISEFLDSILLNMINENNISALRNLFSLGFYDFFPDIYDLCGPDLYDVAREMADFYVGLGEVNDVVQELFSYKEEDKLNDVDWTKSIKHEMVAYVYNRSGVSLIHWSIVSNNTSLFTYLVDTYPLCLRLKDCFNRNVSHYAVAYERDDMNLVIDETCPDARTEMDCFDYLPEYYEFYKNEFRKLI